jgi:DNA gyrase/topoisomerase IV subunit B
MESPRYQFKLNGELKFIYDSNIPKGAKDIKYFKGLGSMTKEAVKYTLSNPKLIAITDAEQIIKDYNVIYGGKEIED